MTVPPSQRSRITSSGMLFITLPSTSTSPSWCSSGGKIAGIAVLARTECHTGPRSWITGRARERLDDTANSGVQRSSTRTSPNRRWKNDVTLRAAISDVSGSVWSRSLRRDANTFAISSMSSAPRPCA